MIWYDYLTRLLTLIRLHDYLNYFFTLHDYLNHMKRKSRLRENQARWLIFVRARRCPLWLLHKNVAVVHYVRALAHTTQREAVHTMNKTKLM